MSGDRGSAKAREDDLIYLHPDTPLIATDVAPTGTVSATVRTLCKVCLSNRLAESAIPLGFWPSSGRQAGNILELVATLSAIRHMTGTMGVRTGASVVEAAENVFTAGREAEPSKIGPPRAPLQQRMYSSFTVLNKANDVVEIRMGKGGKDACNDLAGEGGSSKIADVADVGLKRNGEVGVVGGEKFVPGAEGVVGRLASRMNELQVHPHRAGMLIDPTEINILVFVYSRNQIDGSQCRPRAPSLYGLAVRWSRVGAQINRLGAAGAGKGEEGEGPTAIDCANRMTISVAILAALYVPGLVQHGLGHVCQLGGIDETQMHDTFRTQHIYGNPRHIGQI
ncbi:hypothetical protein B0H17DRAFT_1143715 [Mycena rosella]|uniref:Uncharacterized protein n=1 Tax=Mycena rosella TaxID=1033263 RepID=A0AAD7CVA8_MYCRO|nr:hypothetical protein B0H17DRAFT_1143715 [Mycena rosella]